MHHTGSLASKKSQVPPQQVGQQPMQQPQPPQPYAPRPQQPDAAQGSVASANRAAGSSSGTPNGDGRRSGGLHSAAASLETVERALGDLRVANGARGGRRGGPSGGRGVDIKAGDLRVPATDFDFAGSNARFDKAALASGSKSPKAQNGSTPDEEKTNPSDNEDGEVKEKAAKEEEKAYNPSKSFFDSLSSSTQGLGIPQGGGRGGRGRGGGRNRREEERERNVATFGEPGGVGLMGPGAYVGGWGGYGRRGGGRGRRNPQVGGR
ncbi:hypothetical protein EW146_g5463 [Bondarzewia mesenterica]|uniref:DFDF domain-containing protein n=1 Tax=Bondarzewia mesenterica TaxID=1095465 RepID=A0A4S4LRC5_9AGAM|nr:hypothetical protein EW146_g5463 [Bondarzewia mesenterica]